MKDGVFRSTGGRRLTWLLVIVAVAYFATNIGYQAGARTLGLTMLAAIGAALLAAVVFGVLRFRVASILVATVIPLVLWIAVWGSYSFPRDSLGAALGLALAWPTARLLTHWRQAANPTDLERPRRRFMRRFLLAAFSFVWIINSTLDVIFESRTAPRERVPLSAAQAGKAPWPRLRVGVALSGGGYRAAIMHAGVLAELDAMRVPVTALSCVSGGSIIGSFYAAGGDPATFRDAVADGRLNLKRDMADMHNALRLPFPAEVPYLGVELLPWFSFGRVDVQANLVDRVLLGGVTLQAMQDPGRPRLQICATDLRTGSGVGLAADGVALRSPPRPARSRSGGALPYEVARDFHPTIDPGTRVADLVAASGAFPGAFSAVALTLPATASRAALPLQLADGGIVDNWGVGLLLDRSRGAPDDNPWRLDVLLISAGGRVLEVGEDVPSPEELRRAIDVVYETAGWRPVELVGGADRPPIVLLQPGDADTEAPEYRTFAEASTLTDRFTGPQAGRLFELGRQLVRNAAGELTALLEAADKR